ncbi:lysine decarboxylase [Staphylococcus taiwanensis]|nr:lysine decarboxylase [Staphylococcus taiwanensis]
MKLPITEKLNQLNKQNAISLHVPGHKNMTIGHLDHLKISMDMTEITGLDDLHHPEDIILKSMENIEKHPNYDAYFLVNGTTSGILAVVQAFSEIEGNYLISRNVHKSVFHGLDLVQQPADILPMFTSDVSNQYLGPETHHFNHNQKLSIVTYPNYYGECFNIKEFVIKMHCQHIPVLVDEAHGAHFNLQHFPKSSLESNADYVVQSYHKTLPALTMGSMLFIHKNAPMKEEVIRYLGYFQTSSPSYLVMSSLEMAHQFFNDYQSELFFEKRKQFINTLKLTGFNVIEVNDALKLLIQYPGYSGYDIQTWFEQLDIYAELADDKQVLFVLPLWHKDDTYPYETLLHKISQLDLPSISNNKLETITLPTKAGIYYPQRIHSTIWVDMKEAINKVLAKHIIPYPPGVPIFLKGERITQNMIELVQDYLQKGNRVEGIIDEKILVKDE